MRKLLLICVVLVLSSVAAHAQTATEILAKVTTVYASCRTYSDEGSTNTETSGRGGRQTYFRTNFAKPASFRFELWLNSQKPPGDALVVWKSGDVIRGWGTPASIGDRSPAFDTALLRMSSVSSGGSLTIPQLLLPSLFRVSDLLTLMVAPKVAGEDKVDGRQAFRIEGTLWDQPVKLWIDKTQYVILKTYRKVNFAGRSEEATVQYKPRLNVDIPPEDLALPPSRNQSISRLSGSDSSLSSSASFPTLAPKLRMFGSSLSLGPNEKTGRRGESRTNDEDVVRVETDLVVCSVLVVDAGGKIVRGLTREDFIVKEDDKPQEVASLSLGDSKDLPRSIVLIIDYSGSQLPYIRTSIESAKMLVDKLNPKDRMAVVTDDVKLLVDFTSDKQLLRRRLESLKTSALNGIIGASDQYDALMATLNELFDNEDIRPIVILQTDGDELDSLKGGRPLNPYWLPRKFGMNDILTATEKTRATVYSVISGVQFAGAPEAELPQRARLDWENRQKASFEILRPGNALPPPNPTNLPEDFFTNYSTQWRRRQLALVGLAKYTGAWAEFLERPEQADEIYTRVLTDIDRRYVIGYYPTNRARDGKRRKVSIEVRNHPEYLVWGQKSYFAREEK